MSGEIPTFDCGTILAGWFPPDIPIDGGGDDKTIP